MFALIFAIAALLMTRVSSNPDALQQLYGTPFVGPSYAGSPAPANVRSGLIFTSSQALDSFDTTGLGDLTITQETTVDVFKTVTNVIYNSVPITLTEFVKTTAVQPTLQVLSTPVDDHVFVATAPVTRTDSVTVTNTNTGYFYVTEISTDIYTITHKAYEILQKTLTSTLQQTQVFRPTVVRTRINTEYDTQTVEYLVTNTVVIQPRSTLPFGTNPVKLDRSILVTDQQGFGQGLQGFGNQQGSGQGFGNQQGSGQGFGNQQGSGQGFGNQQGSGQGFGNQQGSGQGFGNQQGSGQGFGNQQGSGHGRESFRHRQSAGQGAVGQTGRNVDLDNVFSEDEERRMKRNMRLLIEHGKDSLKLQ